MRAASALARREIVRFARQPSRVIGAVAPPVLVWILMGAGFGTSFRAPGGEPGASSMPLLYFYPGTVVLVVLFASIFATISVIEDRREGFLQSVLVSPARPIEIAAGKVLGGTVLGLLQGAALLVFLPFLPVSLRGTDVLQAILVLVLVSLALTGLGFSIAWSLESTQGFHSVMNLFLIPMWLLSGAFFPLLGAPPWLRAVMALDPLTYGVAALRRALAPASAAGLPSFGVSVAVTAGFALATLALSAALVAKNPSGPAGRSLRVKAR
jgi:ABC-2 type transport system permease protein